MSTTLLKNDMPQEIESNIGFDADIAIVDLEAVEAIEDKLIELFEEDKKLVNPVFLFIKEGFTEKLSYFLCDGIKRPVAIGIAGETASGKSTVALDVLESIEQFEKKFNLGRLVTRLNTDDYYYDRSKEVIDAGGFANFAKNYDLDVPAAFELDLLKSHIEQLVLGKEVMLPKYDMSGTARRYDNYSLATPNKIILSEGLFTLTDTINDVFDFCIYVEVDHEEQKKRFYRRASERGLGDAAQKIYENAVSKAEIHVKPSSKNADIIVNGMANREDYRRVVNKILDIAISVQKAKV